MNSSSILHRFGSASALALVLTLLALLLPWATTSAEVANVSVWQQADWLTLSVTVALCALAGVVVNQFLPRALLVTALTLLALWQVTSIVKHNELAGQTQLGFWLLVIAIGFCV